ncbi:hypothetical protein [Pseudoclavibacter sp. AY1H1]|uniref:hypothetical protein n=1 Tax=Pseudoclavibacter sp. AY1H1 TaxID=2080584 RepID=UPI000CE7E5A5|nr:hypothetical protein [Pseudoclavibacter sp. AY1H1]PPF38362.1 hypothetical protein C5E05_04945 [Pseudoclavibacter sp. AY1H1]
MTSTEATTWAWKQTEDPLTKLVLVAIASCSNGTWEAGRLTLLSLATGLPEGQLLNIIGEMLAKGLARWEDGLLVLAVSSND